MSHSLCAAFLHFLNFSTLYKIKLKKQNTYHTVKKCGPLKKRDIFSVFDISFREDNLIVNNKT